MLPIISAQEGAPLQIQEPEPGLGQAATAAVIAAVVGIVLVGAVVMVQRERAVEAWEAATAVAEAGPTTGAEPVSEPSATLEPDPPGRYTVQRGDSLFSVAADLGVSPNELIYWNRDEYPTLQSTPALRPGWVLRIEGPPLPTPTPRPTPTPTPEPIFAAPNVPGLPTVTAASFPASERVTVSWYAVTGATPGEILDSIDASGPWSEWVGGRATATVLVRPSFDFDFQTNASGCSVVPTGDPAVSISYSVTLPAWTPPDDGASPGTLEWWANELSITIVHEAHHITLYEEHLVEMREAVATGTCESVPDALQVIWDGALRANCEFDVVEYGAASGLTLESCLEEGRRP
jgi:predicted secreted Zn-dependent protease